VLKVAVFGDRYIKPAILAEALQTHLAPIAGPLAIVTCELDYPLEPVRSNGEIREFAGTEDQVAEVAAGAEVIACHMPAVSRAVIERLPSLRAIGCCRTEPVNVNVAAATEAGIPVLFTPARNARAVAEFTVGMIIAETRNIGRGHRALAGGVWRSDLYLYERAPHELNGQTVGLIGFGNIGRMLPAYLKPFGVRVLAYDPYVPDEVFVVSGAERVTDMEFLLAESDIVSLHARVTPETRGFIGEAQFRRMKPGAYFINTARGPMVDYDALYRALSEGRLAGAGLETFAMEPPPPDWPLLKLENVTLSPHIAGASKESAALAADQVASALAVWRAGGRPDHCANPSVLRS